MPAALQLAAERGHWIQVAAELRAD